MSLRIVNYDFLLHRCQTCSLTFTSVWTQNFQKNIWWSSEQFTNKEIRDVWKSLTQRSYYGHSKRVRWWKLGVQTPVTIAVSGQWFEPGAFLIWNRCPNHWAVTFHCLELEANILRLEFRYSCLHSLLWRWIIDGDPTDTHQTDGSRWKRKSSSGRQYRPPTITTPVTYHTLISIMTMCVYNFSLV
jgi:hypothetical protein